MNGTDEKTGGWTPSRWLLDGRTVYAVDETGNNNRFSLRIEGGFKWRTASMDSTGERTPESELDANARLIAAAPELYEALAALHESYVKACPFANVVAQGARAALAKARGDQP